MLSPLHAALTALLDRRPELAGQLLDDVLDVSLPPYSHARAGSADLVEPHVSEHHADSVILFGEGGRTVFAVVVEIQLRRRPEKRRTWAHYVTGVGLREDCPTFLLVVCPDPAVAAWAAHPIELDAHGSQVLPRVLGPGALPVISGAEQVAEAPEIAVLSVLAHAGEDAIEAFAEGLAAIPTDLAIDYSRLVLAALPGPARTHLEELMATETHVYQSEFTRRLHDEGRAQGAAEGRAQGAAEGRAQGAAEGRAQGAAEGRAAVLLRILSARGIEITDEARADIMACADLEQLERWSVRALDVATAEELFDGP